MGDPVEVNVLVDDEHLPKIDEVASALGREGLAVAKTLRSVGVITGSVADTGVTDALRAVAGVVGGQVGPDVKPPPPDAPVQEALSASTRLSLKVGAVPSFVSDFGVVTFPPTPPP